jgi:ribosomal protein L33
MSQDNLITLYNKETKEHITTRKNKKRLANAPKLELKKFSKKLRKPVTFVETKKIFKKK